MIGTYPSSVVTQLFHKIIFRNINAIFNPPPKKKTKTKTKTSINVTLTTNKIPQVLRENVSL